MSSTFTPRHDHEQPKGMPKRDEKTRGPVPGTTPKPFVPRTVPGKQADPKHDHDQSEDEREAETDPGRTHPHGADPSIRAFAPPITKE